ncbi:MAG TPA: sulfatase [Candidatus Binatia bacterium]|nr:sulfatase [Candidatus Binatia bacterium]
MGRRLLVAVLLCVLLGACGSDETRVVQDLTTTRRGFTDGRPVTVAVEGNDVERRLTAPAPGALDVTVRTPDAAALRYSLPPDLPPAAVTLGVAREATVTPLTPVQDPDGVWRAPLPDGDGRITDLQLATSTNRPLSLIAPRIEGRAHTTPPILPPEARRPGRPPNVILYVVDTLRAGRLSLYGYERPTTPTLERLAERGIVFDRAYAAGSFTTPSVTSLLSSRYPEELLGTLDRDGPARETLAEAFQAAGYETAGFQANVLCTPALGYDRGFDHYQLLGEATLDGLEKASAEQLHAAALGWVRQHLDQPFFLYLQSMDVHFPYIPPSPFRDLFPTAPDAKVLETILAQLRKTLDEEQIRVFFDRMGNMNPDRYDGAIAYADHEIGVLFEALARLGLADHTIVVVTADHGEPLGDRGEMLHGRSLWEELVRVPLVMWIPGVDGGERIDEVVSHLDLSATLLDLAGIAPPKSFVGRSWLAPGTTLRPPGAVGELLLPPSHRAIAWYAREGPWKLVLDDKGPQLFHLPTDPGETQDVSAANPEVTRYLVGRATARPLSASTTKPPGAGLSDEDRKQREEALRALGYVH